MTSFRSQGRCAEARTTVSVVGCRCTMSTFRSLACQRAPNASQLEQHRPVRRMAGMAGRRGVPVSNLATTGVEAKSTSKQVRRGVAVLALEARWKSKVISANTRSAIQCLEYLGEGM